MRDSMANVTKTARQRLGFSQLEFASLLGVTNTTVSRWESSYSVPNNEFHRGIVVRIAELSPEVAQSYARQWTGGAQSFEDRMAILHNLVSAHVLLLEGGSS